MTPGGIEISIHGICADNLLSKSVERLSLSLQGIDDIKSGDRLSASVLGVGDGVSDDVLKEGLENGTSFFVHHTGDALDTTTTCKTADSWLRDALDVIAHHFAMSLGTAFA